jgi:5-hydroxyisourate hydrolase-like protein (transthyretin family)
MTPDAINLNRNRGVETKCTSRSMKNDVTDTRGEFASWWIQMMGYAKGTYIMFWDLYALFLRGDYGANRAPCLKHYEVEFSVEEVEANWRMIRNQAKWMIDNGRV